MQSRFFISLGDNPEHQTRWLCRDETDHEVQHGSLKQAAAAAAGARITILAPARTMTCADVVLPAMRGVRLQKALPYAIEEQLAADVELMHFATGKRTVDGHIPVIAVSRSDMLHWLAMFQQAALHPHQMLNEALALPLSDGNWTMLLEDTEALLRRSIHDGLALPLPQMEAWLKLGWTERDSSIKGLTIYDARRDAFGDAFTPPDDMQVNYLRCDDSLKLLADNDTRTAINLLCGEFSRQSQHERLWRPWRGAAAMLLVLLTLQIGMAISERYQLSSKNEHLYQAIESTYRETFPEARTIVNPKIQMERQLAVLRGGGQSTFVHMLSITAPVLNTVNTFQMLNLRYRQGELELELELATLTALEQLKSGLEQTGLQVEIGTATTRDNRVAARLTLRGRTE